MRGRGRHKPQSTQGERQSVSKKGEHKGRVTRGEEGANLRAHRELSASPRNPNVDTVKRSSNSVSFDVWCLRVRAAKLAGATPLPLSDTSISSRPWSFSFTSVVYKHWLRCAHIHVHVFNIQSYRYWLFQRPDCSPLTPSLPLRARAPPGPSISGVLYACRSPSLVSSAHPLRSMLGIN